MTILLTGFTGNLGPAIASQLRSHRVVALVREIEHAPRLHGVTLVEGCLERLPMDLAAEVEVIVHSAASTRFRAPREELWQANVEGTAHLLEFAGVCPRLERFVHLSTTCIAGDTEGLVPEAPLLSPPVFVNHYEESKWEAEKLVFESGLPIEVVRLAIVGGSERDGSVRRTGALQRTLYWLYKGLIPMMPGRADSAVDVISTEFAAELMRRLLGGRVSPGRVINGSAGDRAPSLAKLLEHLAEIFSREHHGWASGAVTIPDIVDASTFELFEESARISRDVVFQRVCDDARSFLPGLLHSRSFETSLAEDVPLADWRALVGRNFEWLLASDWGRNATSTPTHEYAGT